jgi:hypothetical protein
MRNLSLARMLLLWFAGALAVAAPGQMPPPPPPSTDQTPPTSVTATAQAAVPAREAPGAIYQDAMQPLEVVRASLDNWSEVELAALTAGMQKAREACDAAKPDEYQGEDLYDLAHLCAFGQDWSSANDAAQKYMASKAQAHETQAMAISVRALAHIGAIDLARATTFGLLQFPYDADVAYTVRYMKDTLEQAGDPKALTLARDEHVAIVQALSQPGPLRAAGSDAAISTGVLYASAMELAFFNRFADNSDAAAAAAADADAALQKLTSISAEDQQEIDQVRTQYHLLGAHLPNVHPTRTLQSASAKPRIDPNFGAATVLVLFSDWCIECRQLVKTMTKFAAAHINAPIHVYALLYAPDSSAGAQGAGKMLHAENEKQLTGTPTFEVPAQIAQTFGVVDYPLGVVLDRSGIIRFIGVLPGNAFEEKGYISKVLERMSPKIASKRN